MLGTAWALVKKYGGEKDPERLPFSMSNYLHYQI